LIAFDYSLGFTHSVLSLARIQGLLNVVAAPQLAEDSTQRALRTAGGMFRRTLLEKFSVSHQETSSIEGARQSLSEEGPFTDNVTWFSGWPRLDNSRKNMQSGFAGGTQLILYRYVIVHDRGVQLIRSLLFRNLAIAAP
jgi:hypothetical protein